jgi:hypothetical protein
MGLARFRSTHGLRRGLQSCAVPRLAESLAFVAVKSEASDAEAEKSEADQR